MNEEKHDHPAPEDTETPVIEPAVTHKSKKKKDKSSGWRDTASTIGVIILAPIVALFLTQFVFQSYQVDGPSMESTLQNGDRLIVTKTGKTWARITGSDYIPKRYEIIIFNHSGEFSGSGGQVVEKQLVKRVIGLPGDRVQVKDGLVIIYNAEHPDGYFIDRVEPAGKNIGPTPDIVDVTIKTGEIFVMGDNRINSLDSGEFGPIESHDIVGRLVLRIYPFDKADTF